MANEPKPTVASCMAELEAAWTRDIQDLARAHAALKRVRNVRRDEGDYVRYDDLLEALADAPAPEVTAEDRAVLEACDLLTVGEIGLLTGDERDTSHAECSLGEAILARREAKARREG